MVMMMMMITFRKINCFGDDPLRKKKPGCHDRPDRVVGFPRKLENESKQCVNVNEILKIIGFIMIIIIIKSNIHIKI